MARKKERICASWYGIVRVAVSAALLCLIALSVGCGAPLGNAPADSVKPSSGHSDEGVLSVRHVSVAAAARAEEYADALESKRIAVEGSEVVLHPTVDLVTEKRQTTVMVYMIGSNLESRNAAATDDLQEMLTSGVDYSQTNVVVYAGGSKRWNMNIPTGCNSILDLSRGREDLIVAQTDDAVSLGAPETLASFINFCADNYPAEHNVLIFWDHGGGPLWGYGYDEVSHGDGLLLSELHQAMEETPYARSANSKLDLVGFDACLMGSAENVSTWKDYARYLVASEEVEPGEGWNYTFLSSFNDVTDYREIGATIVRSYGNFYAESASALSNPDVTLACYDLSKADNFEKSLDALFDAMLGLLDNGLFDELSRARRTSKAFGLLATGGRSAGYDLVDVGDFCASLQGLLPAETSNVQESIADMVVHHTENIENVSGVSLYMPGDNRELYETYDKLEESEHDNRSLQDQGERVPARDGAWLSSYKTFVDEYVDTWFSVSEVDWTIPNTVAEEGSLSYQLSDDQVNALSSATYTLLWSDSAGVYTLYMADAVIDVDDEGVLHVPADPMVFVTVPDIGNETPGFFIQVEDTNNKSVFVNNSLSLEAVGNYYYQNGSTEEDLRVTVQVNKNTNDVSIQSLDIDDDMVGVTGKNSVDIHHYSHINRKSISGKPAFDASGNILPWDEWELYTSGYRSMPLEESFRFVAKPISECAFGGTWEVQIVLTDVNGDRHALDPDTLRKGTEPPDVDYTLDTDLGAMTFTDRGDHYELTKYEGYDWTVSIPTEIEGMPVTAIGNGAFAQNTYLDELVLPEGITSIGQGAFEGTGLYTITLPATLEHVSPAAFSEMRHLEQFVVAEGNAVVSSVDGVLFSADGETLISYPNAKGTSYRIPDGVKEIGYGAFAGSDVTSVTLPEGLETIERAAFLGCDKLEAIDFPRSLASIGTAAFGGSGSFKTFAPIKTVYIGPEVAYIGKAAFSGLALRSIEVDSANQWFKSSGGALLNTAGDALLELPWGDGMVFVVPEGVTSLDSQAFSEYPYDSLDFILPASIKYLEESCFPHAVSDDGSNEWVCACTIHAPEGSYALQFAEEHGIPCDTNTNQDSLRHKNVIVEQDGYALTFSVYNDHAVLTSVDNGDDYSARDHTLHVPADVEGKPVTVFDLHSGTYYIETIVLPVTIERISEGSLSELNDLKEIQIDEENKCYQVIDGMLLSADGTVVVAYPGERQGAVHIPEGVERLGSYAFESNGYITEIALPSSLLEIGDHAFGGCGNLERVEFAEGLEVIDRGAFAGCAKLVIEGALPDTLVSIGDSAFASIAGCKGLVLPEGLEVLGEYAFDAETIKRTGDYISFDTDSMYVGPYLESYGGGARGTPACRGLDFTTFNVDEDNDAFVADGPLLLTKDGLAVVDFADGYAGDVHVPEGVRTLDATDIFSYAYRVDNLYLPESLASLSWPKADVESGVYPEYYEPFNSITVHVKRGSYAERFARERGLAWIVE